MISEKEVVFLIEECFKKLNTHLENKINYSSMNLEDVDLCLESVASILCDEGFKENSTPNDYGLKLESVVDYLCNIRFNIEEGQQRNTVDGPVS